MSSSAVCAGTHGSSRRLVLGASRALRAARSVFGGAAAARRDTYRHTFGTSGTLSPTQGRRNLSARCTPENPVSDTGFLLPAAAAFVALTSCSRPAAHVAKVLLWDGI